MDQACRSSEVEGKPLGKPGGGGCDGGGRGGPDSEAGLP